jgi:FAD/FMN-containing dehydrogenase
MLEIAHPRHATAAPRCSASSSDTSRFFDETTLARLRRVRAEIDPDGLFLAKHAI